MEDDEHKKETKKKMFAMILPVLFYEYLAISITKSLVPGMVLSAFGNYSYLAVGIMETIKGILAFLSCPLFGKLSDKIGRKYCLLATVIGTTMPVCILVFTSNMYIFAIAMSLSGFFSATFPLTFAYISDCVDKKKRAPAYGLALATFGLSFCLGPLSGSYLASQLGQQAVFITSLILVLVNIVYIIFFLPETVKNVRFGERPINHLGVAFESLPNTWNFDETFRVFRRDPFMSDLALIVFLYYTSVWAVVSTLMVYVTRHLRFSPMSLGWLLTGYGLATMISEGILVRIIVPWLGETKSMQLGLLAFAFQCIVLAFSSDPLWIFISILFSMFANLVYPSISSLVSKVVSEEMQGEALGALNGIKAVTEGFGPLVFGLFMSLFEDAPIPGSPYLLASVVVFWTFLHCYELSPEPEILIGKGKGEGEGESLLSSASMESDGEKNLDSIPSPSPSPSPSHPISSFLHSIPSSPSSSSSFNSKRSASNSFTSKNYHLQQHNPPPMIPPNPSSLPFAPFPTSLPSHLGGGRGGNRLRDGGSWDADTEADKAEKSRSFSWDSEDG